MKIRSGFVSNSSSCSFTLVGIEGDEKDLEKKFQVDSIWSLGDELLEVYSNPNSDWSYIGTDMSRMGDNQTKAEFIEMVRHHFFVKFGKEIDVDIVSDGWYDG